MSAVPPSLAVVLRDVAASYPLPVTIEPVRSGHEFAVRLSTDGQSSAELHLSTDGSSADQVAHLADQVADWLVEQLPAGGHAAVWPPCPLHPGTHPLTAESDGRHASWICPVSHQMIAAVGELT